MTKGQKKDEFEKSLKRLEEIVVNLESGGLSLDEMVSLFEEGVKLKKICEKKLETARGKIEILLADEQGDLAEAPFDE